MKKLTIANIINTIGQGLAILLLLVGTIWELAKTLSDPANAFTIGVFFIPLVFNIISGAGVIALTWIEQDRTKFSFPILGLLFLQALLNFIYLGFYSFFNMNFVANAIGNALIYLFIDISCFIAFVIGFAYCFIIKEKKVKQE